MHAATRFDANLLQRFVYFNDGFNFTKHTCVENVYDSNSDIDDRWMMISLRITQVTTNIIFKFHDGVMDDAIRYEPTIIPVSFQCVCRMHNTHKSNPFTSINTQTGFKPHDAQT